MTRYIHYTQIYAFLLKIYRMCAKKCLHKYLHDEINLKKGQ